MLSVGGAENLSSPAAPPVQGAVILHALVSKTGAVKGHDVISGAGMPRSSATDAVMQKAQAQAEQDYNDGRIVPIQIGGDVTPPVLIWHPSPDYTEEARKAKVNGNVTVSLIVNNAGIPLNVHVTKGVGLGLDEKAVEAVKRYRFKPASENGKPVPVYMNIEVNFEIFQTQGVGARALARLPLAAARRASASARGIESWCMAMATLTEPASMSSPEAVTRSQSGGCHQDALGAVDELVVGGFDVDHEVAIDGAGSDHDAGGNHIQDQLGGGASLQAGGAGDDLGAGDRRDGDVGVAGDG